MNSKKKVTEDIPVFKNWSSWYYLVASVLVFEIILFYIITHVLA
jgi:p-aminobenzoyl-glutamate transporter AbgT